MTNPRKVRDDDAFVPHYNNADQHRFSAAALSSEGSAHGHEASRGDRRWRLRRPVRGQGAGQSAGQRDAARPPQFSFIPTAVVSSGDGRPVAGEHRGAAALRAAPPEEHASAARRSGRFRSRPSCREVGRRRDSLRFAPCGDRLTASLFRTSGVGNHRAWLEIDRGRDDDAAPYPVGVRGGGTMHRPAAATSVADVRRGRRRSDWRRVGRRRRGVGSSNAAKRFPLDPFGKSTYFTRRRRRPRVEHVPAGVVGEGGQGTGETRRHGADEDDRRRSASGAGDAQVRRTDRSDRGAHGAVGRRRTRLTAGPPPGKRDRRGG